LRRSATHGFSSAGGHMSPWCPIYRSRSARQVIPGSNNNFPLKPFFFLKKWLDAHDNKFKFCENFIIASTTYGQLVEKFLEIFVN
jgi:hypothetical protein